MSPTAVVGLSAAPDGFSAFHVVPHMLSQYLTTFGLCSMVVSSTLNLLTSIPKEFSITLLLLDIL